jgi:pimeloyl-ACP methyl ester carboxylesterase
MNESMEDPVNEGFVLVAGFRQQFWFRCVLLVCLAMFMIWRACNNHHHHQDDTIIHPSCCCGRAGQGAPASRAGFHFRGGSKLHVESVIPKNVHDSKGTILFFHGMLSSGRSFLPMAKALAEEGYHCYMPDLVGFGRSPWPRTDYAVSTHCKFLMETLMDIMDHHDEGMRKRPLHIVGHSFGALVAYEFARALRHQMLRSNEADKTLERTMVRPKRPPSPSSDEDALIDVRANEVRMQASSVVLIAMPFYDKPGQASKGLKRTFKGVFVATLINCPILSLVLCSLICQQRW